LSPANKPRQHYQIFLQIDCDDPADICGRRGSVPTPILQAPLDAAVIGPASRYMRETRDALLAYDTEELAALRFSIILTARWAASEGEDPERRAELREDLATLRKHYEDMVDEIAMTFGVEEAINAKEEVERSVVVPTESQKSTELRSESVGGNGEMNL
jgi:hypothetical protein